MFSTEDVKSSVYTSSFSSNSGVFSSIPTSSTNTLLFGTAFVSGFNTKGKTNLNV